MTYQDETLSAFIDGELSEKERNALEVEAAKDPALKERIARLRRANEAVKSAYADIENEPLPDSVLDLFNKTSADKAEDNVVSMISDRAGAAPRVHAGVLQRFSSAQWPTAIAASLALVVGFGVGQIGDGAPGAAPAMQIAGVIAEDSPVFSILETGASAEMHLAGADGALSVEPVLSLQRADGVFCREYFISDASARFHNVACKENNQWSVKFAVNIPTAENSVGDGYITASAQSNALVADYIDRVIAGDALDAENEQNAISSGWKAQ